MIHAVPQFLTLPELFSNVPPSKYNIYTHDLKKFDEEKFILEFNSQDWDNILALDKENVNEAIDNYLQSLNNVLQKQAPFKKIEQAREKVSTKAFDND